MKFQIYKLHVTVTKSQNLCVSLSFSRFGSQCDITILVLHM